MMFSLEGKTALVTGASGGIGSSIAYALAKQGARLALSGSNGDKLRAFREQLNDEFGHDHVEITCDLSNTTQVEELIPATVDTLGRMDILVNNAGITRDNLAMREAGIERFVEVGGKVLAPMVGRIDKEATTVSLVTMEDLENFAKENA